MRNNSGINNFNLDLHVLFKEDTLNFVLNLYCWINIVLYILMYVYMISVKKLVYT